MMTCRPFLLAVAVATVGCGYRKPAAVESPAPSANQDLFVFRQDADLSSWIVEDDVVMGGRSRGRLAVNEAGNGLFTGDISLENNGGFSSIQYDFGPIDVAAYRRVALGLRGDGKRYQLRVESAPRARHAYALDFETSGDWEVVRIPFDRMQAIRHGDWLDLPNYPGETLARLQILIGNDRAESFQLEIDRIWLE